MVYYLDCNSNLFSEVMYLIDENSVQSVPERFQESEFSSENDIEDEDDIDKNNLKIIKRTHPASINK